MTSQPRTSTSRSNRDDVLQFLDSLDNYSPQSSTGGAAPKSSLPRSTSNSTLPSSHPSSTATPPPKNAKEAQSVLDFLDEITATTSTNSAPPSRTSIDQSSRRTTSSTGIGRTTSRGNISQVAAGQSPGAGTGVGRKSTDSVRSTRSLVNQQPSTTSSSNERNSPIPASRTVTSSSSQLNTPTRPNSSLPEPSLPSPSPSPAVPPAAQPQQSGGWGWSSVWSTASTAINQASALAQQARTVAEEQVKHAAQQAQSGGGFPGEGLMKAAWGTEEEGGVAKKWTEGVQGLVKNANLEHLGKELKSSTLKSLTDLLNAVAPPIAEHEVISIQLSHDMLGYDGVETLVYRGLSKIMEQIEGGTLMVNRAGEVAVEEEKKEKPAEESGEGVSEEERNLNLVHGLDQGWKTAQTKLDDLIKTSYKPPSSPLPDASGSITVPVTTCPVYLRIQPVLSPLPSSSSPSKHLFFLLLLIDPTHSLTHQTLSQSLPATWLDIPFEENEWVEDQMVEVIRRSTEVIGQEYIVGRMRAQKDAIEKAREEARKVVESGQGEGEKEVSEKEEKEREEEVARASQEARVGIV